MIDGRFYDTIHHSLCNYPCCILRRLEAQFRADILKGYSAVTHIDTPQARFDDVVSQPVDQCECLVLLEEGLVFIHLGSELFEISCTHCLSNSKIRQKSFSETFLGEGRSFWNTSHEQFDD